MLPRACQRAADVDEIVRAVESGKYVSAAAALAAQAGTATASVQE